MTKVVDGGQIERSVLSISNFKDQSKELVKSHKSFWFKSLKVIAVRRNARNF